MNIQQLNKSGPNLGVFFGTTVIALLNNGGVWLCIQGINNYRAWRQEDVEDLTHDTPEQTVLARIWMFVWLIIHGHGLWLFRSGAWKCIANNSRSRSDLSELLYDLAFRDNIDIPAGHFVSRWSRDPSSYVRKRVFSSRSGRWRA